VVIPFLASEGVDSVDLLMLSHDDADHAGAWERFVDRSAVSELMAGQPDRLMPAARPCRRGHAWTWDGVRFEVLHPAGQGVRSHDNDASCVLRVVHPRVSFLLTGDITRSIERRLSSGAVGAEFVVVPHHGSRSSSSHELIRATGARFALVSAGYRNRYGFPDPGVEDRWRSAGASILNTADSGAVIIDIDADGKPVITRFRDAARRYWHR
jgi:competence protein ComEC